MQRGRGSLDHSPRKELGADGKILLSAAYNFHLKNKLRALKSMFLIIENNSEESDFR